MMRRLLLLPFGCLVIFAGYIGLRIGETPTDTDIINRYAAAYLATSPAGAVLTDCSATTHADPNVRMVITCAHPTGVTTTYFVDPRGAIVSEPQGPLA